MCGGWNEESLQGQDDNNVGETLGSYKVSAKIASSYTYESSFCFTGRRHPGDASAADHITTCRNDLPPPPPSPCTICREPQKRIRSSSLARWLASGPLVLANGYYRLGVDTCSARRSCSYQIGPDPPPHPVFLSRCRHNLILT